MNNCSQCLIPPKGFDLQNFSSPQNDPLSTQRLHGNHSLLSGKYDHSFTVYYYAVIQRMSGSESVQCHYLIETANVDDKRIRRPKAGIVRK
jgi:hypothetical protein